MCRAIGAALLGPEGRIEFRQYDSDKAFETGAQAARYDLVFVSGSEILEAGLAGKLTPGPPIYFASVAVMAPDASPAKGLADLGAQSICFSLGSNAHRNLEAWFAAHKLDFIRMGYREDVELFDAYNVQVCKG